MEHTLMLLQDAHEGDKAAREQLIRENMGLVYAAVQRFAGRRSCEKEDLIELRYFDDLTQVQTAGALGMTQVQVSRAEKRILRKMRSEIV